MTKITAILASSILAISTLGTTAYAASHAETEGNGGSGAKAENSEKRGSSAKRGDRRGGMRGMCSPEMAEKMAEREAAVDAFIDKYLGLNEDQTGLYSAAKEAQATVKAQKDAACEAMKAGERPERGAMRDAMMPAKEAHKAFYQSLDEEQKATMDLIRPMRGNKDGKRGGMRGGKQGGKQGGHKGMKGSDKK